MTNLWLYLIERPREHGQWDEQIAVVAASCDAQQAREFAKGTAGDEGKGVWESAKLTRIGKASEGVEAGIVLCDFHHG